MQKTIEELTKERSELHDKISEINEKIRQIRLNEINLDIEGKFIKYTSIFGLTHYCYVTEVIFDKLANEYGNTRFSYLIRGHGFCGEFTGYGDATSFDWSYWHEFHIEASDIEVLKKQVENIEIITKEEFDIEFEKQVADLLEYQEKYNYKD